MATLLGSETTSFTLDNMGRYLCNSLQEAIDSAGQTVGDQRRDFDVIVAGAGSFGSVIANGLFMKDASHSRRILVLESGPFVLPEHVQNLPWMGGDPGYGVPWVTRPGSDLGYAGLLYGIGGRSLTWGGWSPELLHDANNNEMAGWPASVVNELKSHYFLDAGEQIGTNSTNDYIYGPLHAAMRAQLFDGLNAGSGPNGPFASLTLADLPDAAPVRAFPRRHNNQAPGDDDLRDMLGLKPNGLGHNDLVNMMKLEAPLAVQSRTEPGQFPINKFSAVPILVEAARLASSEAGGVGPAADARKRLMVVPKCQVLEFITETQPDNWVRVTGVRVRDATGQERVVFLAPPRADGTQGAVVLALGTIESTRVALTTFQSSLGWRAAQRMGRNLLAHLRSNLTIRIPRTALAKLPKKIDLKALQVSALFVKGKARVAGKDRYFHVQITASGLGRFGNDSEAELFKKIPSLEHMGALLDADDTTVVITLRGIGEMVPHNPDSFVDLAKTPSDWENGRPRAFVDIGDARQPAGGSAETQADRALWDRMDAFTDEIALIFANGQPFEILGAAGGTTVQMPAGASVADLRNVHPYRNRRDRLGTTHHDAGTLWMSSDPTNGVTNDFGRIHDTTNCYVAGPALFPTLGSPNPMLTGVALARRTIDLLANSVLPKPAAFSAAPPWRALFDGTAQSFNTDWARVSPNSSNGFALINGEIVTYGGGDFGLLYYAREAFADFTLRLQFRIFDPVSHNSGIFVRFRDPVAPLPNDIAQRIIANGDANRLAANRAWSAVHSGFEIQIDDMARGDTGKDFYGIRPEPDGLNKNRTGAIYKIPAGDAIPSGGFDLALQTYTQPPKLVPGRWYEYEIAVANNDYTVDLTDLTTNAKVRTTTFQNADVVRGIAREKGKPAGYIGLQSYPNATVAFRRIQIRV
jgi:Domain of Unknown Function (DUF1080)/GMC oxidoreductase